MIQKMNGSTLYWLCMNSLACDHRIQLMHNSIQCSYVGCGHYYKEYTAGTTVLLFLFVFLVFGLFHQSNIQTAEGMN